MQVVVDDDGAALLEVEALGAGIGGDEDVEIAPVEACDELSRSARESAPT